MVCVCLCAVLSLAISTFTPVFFSLLFGARITFYNQKFRSFYCKNLFNIFISSFSIRSQHSQYHFVPVQSIKTFLITLLLFGVVSDKIYFVKTRREKTSVNIIEKCSYSHVRGFGGATTASCPRVINKQGERTK